MKGRRFIREFRRPALKVAVQIRACLWVYEISVIRSHVRFPLENRFNVSDLSAMCGFCGHSEFNAFGSREMRIRVGLRVSRCT